MISQKVIALEKQKTEETPAKICNSILGLILHIFAKREFFQVVYDTNVVKDIKGFVIFPPSIFYLFQRD